MWRSWCEEHGIQCCRHPSCWFLKRAYCSASHDSSYCAYQMLSTECVTYQPETCYPWLHKLIDIRSRTASENLFTQWQDLFSVFLSTDLLVRGDSCVSSHIVSSENPCCVSEHPRKHRRVCCHFERRNFVFENCQICSSESTHCGDGSLSCSIELMALPVLSFETTFFCHVVQ